MVPAILQPTASFGLSATSQQYFSLRTTDNTFLSEQPSHQQPANNTFLSEQISISHQPNESARDRGSSQVRETAERTKQPGVMWFLKSFKYSKIDDKRRNNTAIMLIPNFCANSWENFEVL
jgi:hypothetical protein